MGGRGKDGEEEMVVDEKREEEVIVT